MNRTERRLHSGLSFVRAVMAIGGRHGLVYPWVALARRSLCGILWIVRSECGVRGIVGSVRQPRRPDGPAWWGAVDRGLTVLA